MVLTFLNTIHQLLLTSKLHNILVLMHRTSFSSRCCYLLYIWMQISSIILWFWITYIQLYWWWVGWKLLLFNWEVAVFEELYWLKNFLVTWIALFCYFGQLGNIDRWKSYSACHCAICRNNEKCYFRYIKVYLIYWGGNTKLNPVTRHVKGEPYD